MHSIVIIEDHPIMREGLVSWFANSGRWHVIGTASTLAEAKKLVSQNKPDLILLDIQLPDGWGLSIVSQLHEPQPRRFSGEGSPLAPLPAIAVYSSFDDYANVSAALSMGVQAYVTKQRTNQELEAALLQALNGETWIDDTAQARLDSTTNLIKLLSKRETEILQLVKNGLSNKQIAVQLGIATHTVANTISNIYEKTGIKSRMELKWL